MSRQILGAFDEAGIGIASATYDIVGFPPLRGAAQTSINGASEPVIQPPADGP
jgi:hypothetical protein